jgi:hypothetical protein
VFLKILNLIYYENTKETILRVTKCVKEIIMSKRGSLNAIRFAGKSWNSKAVKIKKKLKVSGIDKIKKAREREFYNLWKLFVEQTNGDYENIYSKHKNTYVKLNKKRIKTIIKNLSNIELPTSMGVLEIDNYFSKLFKLAYTKLNITDDEEVSKSKKCLPLN